MASHLYDDLDDVTNYVVPSPLFGEKIFEYKPVPIDSRWKLGKIIGTGYHGKIFEARDKQTNTLCALKVTDILETPHLNISPSIFKEVCIPRGINHPNIIKILSADIYSVKDAGVKIGLSMDIYDGSLNDLPPHYNKNRLSNRQYKEIFFQLLVALVELKKYNIIHANIKGVNILYKYLYGKDEQIQVILSDFGISQSSICDRTLSYDESSLMYAMAYRPPELTTLKKGEKYSYTHASDIWAAAITFYEFFTGTYVFNATSKIQLIAQHSNFSGLSNEIIDSVELRDLLDSMLRVDPNKRATLEECLNHPYFDDISTYMYSWYRSLNIDLYQDLLDSSLICSSKVLNKISFTEGDLVYQSDRGVLLGNFHTKTRGWLFELSNELRLSSQTTLLAAFHLEKYLTMNAFQSSETRSSLQAVTCAFLIMSGYLYEIYLPTLKDYSRNTAHTFSPNQLVNVCFNLMKMLDWKMDVLSLYDLIYSRISPLIVQRVVEKSAQFTYNQYSLSSLLWEGFHSIETLQKRGDAYVKGLETYLSSL